MKVEIWSDVVCPWCYIGKRRFEAAIHDLAPEVEIHWRAFELDPRAPRTTEVPLTEMLAKKYGMTEERARQTQAQITSTGALDGIQFRFEIAKTGNTFDAHKLIQWAQAQGAGTAVKERFMRAYFTDGQAIGDIEVLLNIIADLGLDPVAAKDALQDEHWATQVRNDQLMARQLGISGVPFFVFEGKYGVSGAQPADVLKQVIQKVRQESVDLVENQAPGCDGDSCDV